MRRPAGVMGASGDPVLGHARAVRLHTEDGRVRPLPVRRWLGEVAPEELTVLSRVRPPVLDVGCGPGRHVLALAERATVVLGIDVSPSAVALARARGCPVLLRSVFEHVPRAGGWGTVLLLDGNLGIGGDPDALLRRVAGLLRPGGRILLEAEPPGAGGPLHARLEVDGRLGPWFPWARVTTGQLAELTARTGTRLTHRWEEAGRWFAELRTSTAQRGAGLTPPVPPPCTT